ncbi:MAG: AsnC family transcriptional regulator [Burkholderiales bacterium]|nr:AsnC family transcriptional regulator [Burkholderiales bacterium]
MLGPTLDDTDRAIINQLQDAVPLVERPYREAAAQLGLEEDVLIARLQRLLDAGVLSRLGPMYQIERAGGRYVLVAMRVPDPALDRVIGIVNALPEVAHNYLREHAFNLWFVIAVEAGSQADAVLARIEAATGLPVYAFPKQKEYFLDLRLRA